MAETITLNEMKDVIREEKLSPSDLFGVEALTGDPLIRGYLDTSVKELKGKLSGEYEARKRVEKGAADNKGEQTDEMKKKDEEIQKLKIDGAKRDAVDLFTKKVKERKLDKQQSKFIEMKQGSFSPKDPEALDKEVSDFMDTTLEEHKKTAEIFGQKTTETKEEPKGGGEPGESGESGDDELIPD